MTGFKLIKWLFAALGIGLVISFMNLPVLTKYPGLTTYMKILVLLGWGLTCGIFGYLSGIEQ